MVLHLNNIKSLQSIRLCAKFHWNWPSGLREDENGKSLNDDANNDKKDNEQILIRIAHSGDIKKLENIQHL